MSGVETGVAAISCIATPQKSCAVPHAYSPVVAQECYARKVKVFLKNKEK